MALFVFLCLFTSQLKLKHYSLIFSLVSPVLISQFSLFISLPASCHLFSLFCFFSSLILSLSIVYCFLDPFFTSCFLSHLLSLSPLFCCFVSSHLFTSCLSLDSLVSLSYLIFSCLLFSLSLSSPNNLSPVALSSVCVWFLFQSCFFSYRLFCLDLFLLSSLCMSSCFSFAPHHVSSLCSPSPIASSL